jgi:hypothetical protein
MSAMRQKHTISTTPTCCTFTACSVAAPQPMRLPSIFTGLRGSAWDRQSRRELCSRSGRSSQLLTCPAMSHANESNQSMQRLEKQ